MLLLSKAPKYGIDTKHSKLFISSSVYIRTAKICYSKNDIFHSARYAKLLLCPYPIITTPIRPIKLENLDYTKNLEEEGTMGCHE